MRLPSVQQVAHEAGRTFVRFPLVIVAAAVATVTALILVDYEGPAKASVLFNFLLAAALGIPLLTGLTLFAEKRGFSRGRWLIAQLIGLALLVAYSLTIPMDLTAAPELHFFRFWLLMLGALLFVGVAPYFGSGETNGFWHYNKILCFRILTTWLYSAVLYIGLAVALGALDNLFGVDVPPRRYLELFALVVGMFATWFFLAGVPEDLADLERSDDYPKSVRVFAQYILLPIVCLYLVILYAYIGKIVAVWSWPQGWVGHLIFGFSTTGFATLLMLYPLRERAETAWVKSASRWFYVVMIPLVVVLVLALWRRISEYDLTEGRYLGLLMAVWLAAMVLYFLVSKAQNIRMIDMSLCVMSVLVCFGPWSAFSISERSQVARLSGLLEKNEILVNGSVQKATGKVSFEDSKQISAILSYLRAVHGYDRIQPWFAESLKKDSADLPPRYLAAEDVAEMMGVEYTPEWRGADSRGYSFHVDEAQAVDIRGYDHMISARGLESDTVLRTIRGAGLSYRLEPALRSMTILAMADSMVADSLQLPLQSTFDALREEFGSGGTEKVPAEKMTVAGESRLIRFKLLLQNVHLEQRGDSVVPTYCFGSMVYSVAGRE